MANDINENLARKTQKLFASQSGTNELAAFGSMISGTPIYTDDPEAIQTKAYTQGWSAAVAYNTAPFMQENNAVLYSLSYQIAYLLQKGFAEWDENENYFTNSYCQYGGVPYVSLTDNNLGNNPSTDNGTNWQIKRFMEIATDEQAASGELENVAINPKQLQTSVTNLQSQIDAITSASDVTDVVGTHAELETYNTSGLSDKSIIKVLSDETQNGATTYYRWVISGSSGSWVLIGQEGPYYTISQSDNTFVKKVDYATATTAGIVKIGDGLTVTSDGVLQGTNGSATGLEIGDYVFRSLPTKDAGKHLADGSLIEYGVYSQFVDNIAELYEENPNANYFTDEETWQETVAKYGSCGKYVYDPENKTVRLPKTSDIIQGTTDLNALGDLIEAKIPNITGLANNVIHRSGIAQGSLEYSSTSSYTMVISGGSGTHQNAISNLLINASDSSPVYSDDCDTVQPQTIRGLLYIVVANSTKTDVEVDIDKVMVDLNGKTDVDLTNLSDTGKNVIDGQWTQKYLVLSEATALNIGSYTYDLSNYLPNDGNRYEVKCYLYVNSGAITYMFLGDKEKPYSNQQSCIWGGVTTGPAAVFVSNTFDLPLNDNSRTIYLQVAENKVVTTCKALLLGYRRIGTNV